MKPRRGMTRGRPHRPLPLAGDLRVTGRCERLGEMRWRAEVRVEGGGGLRRSAPAADTGTTPAMALRRAFDAATRALQVVGPGPDRQTPKGGTACSTNGA